MSQKVCDLTNEEIRTLLKLNDTDVLTRTVKFVHVFPLKEKMTIEQMEDVADKFNPLDFFDETCPHCKPFLDDGAVMLHDESDLIGMRLLKGGLFETVMLRTPFESASEASTD